MAAIADCANAIKGMGNGGGDVGMAQLNQRVSLTTKAVQRDLTLFTQQGHKESQLPMVHSDGTENDMRRQTRSMAQQTWPLTRVSELMMSAAVPTSHNNQPVFFPPIEGD